MSSGGVGQYLYTDSRWPACKIDRVLKDGDEVTLGGVTLVAHSTPGHTRGCTTWTWQVSDAAKMYDLLITQISTIVGTAFAQPHLQELAVSFLQEADDERWNWG